MASAPHHHHHEHDADAEARASSEALEAFAFRALVQHLRDRPSVQNIDLMNLAGFCRNCLSKWYLRGSEELGLRLPGGYDDALLHVYGVPYKEWKATHQAKATPEQLALFESSTAHHAEHGPSRPHVPPPLSDVCCVESSALACAAPKGGVAPAAPTPAEPDYELEVGVLTVSDRASAGVYEDLSGPETQRALEEYGARTGAWRVRVRRTAVVPDELAQIEGTLKAWSAPEQSGEPACRLILTTGGTGCSPRDVTPEATRAACERLVPGIAEAVLLRALPSQPHAMLSRGVAGIRGKTLVVNLPGRPNAVRENLAVLMPALKHTLRQLDGC